MNRKLIVVIFSLLLPTLMLAQTFRNPYSFYGIGELQDYSLISSQSLGGLDYGWNDRFSFSTTNPASYSNIETTIFDVGIKGKIQDLEQDQTSEWTNYFSFAYAVFGFPISRKHNWGLSFGILPISRIGYKNSLTFNEDTTTAIENFDKQGGFNKIYVGSSISLFDHLNVGFNVAYVFGNTSFNHSLGFQNNATFLGVEKDLFKNYYGLGIDIGLQYKNSLKKDLQYTIGAAFSLPVNLIAYQETTTFTYINSGSSISYRDTLELFKADESNLSIPLTLGIGGIMQKKNKWKAGFDFKYEKWSDFIPENKDFALSDQWSLALGGEFVPKFDQIAYFQRVAYRAGLRYTNSFLKVNGEQYRKISGVIGVGLPISRNLSNINVALEVGTMGKSSPTLIKETFFNIFLGFRLNDIWFIKPKYD